MPSNGIKIALCATSQRVGFAICQALERLPHIESIKVYDSRKRELIRFNQKVGDVDFAISFDDGYGIKTGFVRFKNNKSAERFNNYLNLLVLR